MAKLKASIKQFLLPGLVLYIVLVVALHIIIDDLHFVVTGMGLATLLLAVAAIITAAVRLREHLDEQHEKQVELEERQAELEHKVNGGMAEATRKFVQEDEVIMSVVTRMDRFERERDDCLEKYDELHRFVLKRLDESGQGRSQPREAT